MTYTFVVNPLTNCTTLLGDTLGKETIYKITLDFIVNFNLIVYHNMDVSHNTLVSYLVDLPKRFLY